MKVYIVVAQLGGDDGEVIDRVYSHPDDAAARVPRIFSAQGELQHWRESQSSIPTTDQAAQWGAGNDIGQLAKWLDSIVDVSVEEREVIDAPIQYVEYCQLDYKVDCRKPNLGGPESHMRGVADINDVDIIDGRVQWKTTA